MNKIIVPILMGFFIEFGFQYMYVFQSVSNYTIFSKASILSHMFVSGLNWLSQFITWRLHHLQFAINLYVTHVVALK